MQSDNSLLTFFLSGSYLISEQNLYFSANTYKKGYFCLKCDQFDDTDF